MSWLPRLSGIASIVRDRIMAQQTNPATNPTTLTDPEPTPDPQTLRDDYYARQLEYEDMLKAFQTSQQNANYGWDRWNQGSNMYNQMEQQRENGSLYGGNRFYNQGEIYEYDPATGSYRGSISGRVIAQPTDYVQPELAPHPGEYDDWMASDPYYQGLQEPSASTQQPLPYDEWRQTQSITPTEIRGGGSGAYNDMINLQNSVKEDRLQDNYNDYLQGFPTSSTSTEIRGGGSDAFNDIMNLQSSPIPAVTQSSPIPAVTQSAQQPLSYADWLNTQSITPIERRDGAGPLASMWDLQEQSRNDRLRRDYDNYIANFRI